MTIKADQDHVLASIGPDCFTFVISQWWRKRLERRKYIYLNAHYSPNSMPLNNQQISKEAHVYHNRSI